MAFHLFQINEIYSNADGTVQFIELIGMSSGQNFLLDHAITVTHQDGTEHNFDFDRNLPSSATAGRSVLIATQGFADLGLVTPDYIVFDGFMFLDGGTVTFPGGDDSPNDTLAYSDFPGGTQSLNGSGATGTNSPTNFAGNSAVIPGNPIVGTAAANTLGGTSARDFVVGLGGGDTLTARGGSDTVNGGSGNDLLNGGPGNDVLIGGTGKDTATYQTAASAVSVNLAASQATGGAGSDTLSGIERATGSGYADKLTGNNASNVLKGLGDGDTLIGRGGNDSLTGGPGTDRLVFNADLNANTNVDRIMDFNGSEDVMRLDQDVFTRTSLGAPSAGAFNSGTDAVADDANDRIIYDSSTGRLYYDGDGDGNAFSAVHFATLTSQPQLAPDDFFIIA